MQKKKKKNFTNAQKGEISIVSIISAKNVINTERQSQRQREWRENTSPQWSVSYCLKKHV